MGAGYELKTTYRLKYVIRRISEDGLIKKIDDVSDYSHYDTPKEALKYCERNDIRNAIILQQVVVSYE